jgi:hypothetical protein
MGKRKSPTRSKSPKKGDPIDTGFINTLLSDVCFLVFPIFFPIQFEFCYI